MRPINLLLLLLGCFLPNVTPAQTPAAKLCGRLLHLDTAQVNREVRIFTPSLSYVRMNKIMLNIQADGTFCADLPVERLLEARLDFQGEVFPLILAPGDSLYLEIDLLAYQREKTRAFRFKGDGKILNQAVLAVWPIFEEQNEKIDSISYELSPAEYRKQLFAQWRQSRDQLDAYLDDHTVPEIAREWAYQTVNLKVARQLFTYGSWHAQLINDPDFMYRLVKSEHFDSWRQFRELEPQQLISISYHQFLTTTTNYLNFLTTATLVPEYPAMSEEERMEALVKVGDSLYISRIEYILRLPKNRVQDHLLGLVCGNALEFPFMASTVSPAFIREIRDEALRRQVEARYESQKNQHISLKDPELLLTPPDTVSDIIGWLGREFAGQVVLLDFWATWCGSCIYGIEYKLPDFVPEFKDQPLVTVLVGVASEKTFLIERANRLKFKARHLFPDKTQDQVLREKYAVRNLPRYILLGRDGKIVELYAPSPGPELADLVKREMGR